MPAVNVHQQKALLPHPLINGPGVFCGDFLCCNVFLKSFHLPGNGALLNIGVIIVVTQPRSRGKQERIFSVEMIYETVWGEPYYYTSNGTVMVHIRNLRTKIEADPQNPKRVCTVWGKGYRFVNEERV